MPYEPVLGQIMPFAGSIVPKNWALCNGALLPISQWQALFSLLGTTYGGNGVTTFGLPNLQGRAILGADTSSYPPGTMSGSPQVTLQIGQLPQHNHNIQASTNGGSGRGATPANNVFGVNTAPSDKPKAIFLKSSSSGTALAQATNIVNSGGGQPHNNMQPYLVISYLIALTGTYPSRN